jgi:hypothetical protein
LIEPAQADAGIGQHPARLGNINTTMQSPTPGAQNVIGLDIFSRR